MSAVKKMEWTCLRIGCETSCPKSRFVFFVRGISSGFRKHESIADSDDCRDCLDRNDPGDCRGFLGSARSPAAMVPGSAFWLLRTLGRLFATRQRMARQAGRFLRGAHPTGV